MVDGWDNFQDTDYIPGVRCDESRCYACAKQKYNCNRLDELDSQQQKKDKKTLIKLNDLLKKERAKK